MAVESEKSILRLHDGRAIGIAQSGKSDGFPVFHFHGSSSSRLEVKIDKFSSMATANGVRLIGLDRPGIGSSDRTEDYRLLDWPDDVAEVADLLGIKQFAVEGISAGGPYAMACAYKIPERLTACGIISTLPPTNLIMKAGPMWMRAVWWTGTHFPGLIRVYLSHTMRDSPPDVDIQEKRLLSYSSWYGDADKKLIQDPEVRRGVAQAFAESHRHDVQGNRDEALRLLKPWGFKAEEIKCKKVFLWHGEDDHIMPIAPARLLAEAIPHCNATFFPNDGHFSTLVNHVQDIFKSLG